MKAKPGRIIVTCEHGGKSFPKNFSHLFQSRKDLLESHRGFDPGALALAEKLSRGLKAPLYFSTLTRLLIDLNRSPWNPRRFSVITGGLNAAEKGRIEKSYYLPYRKAVEAELMRNIRKGQQVLHLSVHTFVPVLDGKTREADIGFLYDPKRKSECAFCVKWQKSLHRLSPALRTRRNYPYKGTSDGFTSYLRKRFPEVSYLGIELEVNQKYLSTGRSRWLDIQNALLRSFD